ncbi:MAG: hypothetical protein Q8O67_16920 [Deltaproteobacteria bacterium]|nr:hypothetical protein [Deltaproteobacteria bacterium]
MTKISERPPTQATQQKQPISGPPPAAPPADDDVVEIGDLTRPAPSVDTGSFRGPLIADPRLAPKPAKTVELDLTGEISSQGGAATDVGPLPGPRAASSTFATVEEGIAALESTYGVRVVPEGWTAEELSRVHESLALMGPKEAAALKGVELRREHEGPLDGEAGFFDPKVAPAPDGTRAEAPRITWFDNAFPTTDDAGADRRTSMQVVLHEAGHAVDGPGTSLAAKAGADLEFTTANHASKKDVAVYKEAAAAFKAKSTTTHKAALEKANKAWLAAANQVNGAKTEKQLTVAVAALDKATRARDAALSTIGPDHPLAGVAKDLASAQDAVAKDTIALTTAELKGNKARVDVKRDYAVTDDKDTAALDETRTRGVVAFEKSIKGDTPISPYGASSPVENFAEAYALYRRAPEWLAREHPKAFEWMKSRYP